MLTRHWKPLAASAAALLGAGAGTAGLIAGLTWMTERAEAALREAPGVGRVRFDWPTIADGRTWLADTDRAGLTAFAERALTGEASVARPLSDVPLERLRRALLTSRHRGWFSGEPRVLRSREDGSVRVETGWRVPGAVVRAGGRDHLVSWSGMPMPRTFEPDTSGLPLILGAAQSPGRYNEAWRRYAEPWPGRDVEAGLELLAELHRRGMIDLVTGVDVGAVSSNGPLLLRTRHGAELVWGGPLGSFRPGQADDAVRLARIPQAVAYLDELAATGRAGEARAARIDLSGLVAEIDGTPAPAALEADTQDRAGDR